jgi:hypothetical protein
MLIIPLFGVKEPKKGVYGLPICTSPTARAEREALEKLVMMFSASLEFH